MCLKGRFSKIRSQILSKFFKLMVLRSFLHIHLSSILQHVCSILCCKNLYNYPCAMFLYIIFILLSHLIMNLNFTISLHCTLQLTIIGVKILLCNYFPLLYSNCPCLYTLQYFCASGSYKRVCNYTKIRQ